MLEIENITYNYVTYLDNNLNIDVKDFSLVRDYVIKEILNNKPEVYKKMLVLLIKDIIKLDKTNITIGNTKIR